MDTPSNQSKIKEDLDQAIERIKCNIIAMGFPDPGNVRSSKKRDTR